MIGPRLLNPDGTLQRSVRGFPTVWRLATEYFFLRKLAPGSSALNAFYGGGFDHDEVREVEVVMGACMLLRRAAVDEVGYCDEDYFLFSEETDWCFRFREAGWEVVFFPGAECIHVRGASHSGRLYRENLRGHLLFLTKHRGPKVAERARRLLLASLRLRGFSSAASAAGLPRGCGLARFRRRRRHSSGADVVFLYVRLAVATAVVLAPGWLLARALGDSERVGDARVVVDPRLRGARRHVRARRDADP